MNFTPSKQYFLGNAANCPVRLSPGAALLATAMLTTASLLSFASPASGQEPTTAPKPATAAPQTAQASPAFSPLGEHWEKCSFGGDGAVYFTKTDKQGLSVEMFAGDPITGIRWTGKFPKENYELRLQARRVDGFDFFAAVTFPVGKEYCSFVLGGWGGGIVGISSIDGADASSNDTTQYKEFETGKWYTIRIRVDEMTVRCWIDDVEYAVVPRHKHELEIRLEMDPCVPLGIANYLTRSELRNIEMRKLGPEDTAKETQAEPQAASDKATDTK